MRTLTLRSRIEALERRAARDAPTLTVVELYEDDDLGAAERWLAEHEARAPQTMAVVVRLLLTRPPGKPQFWISPPGGPLR